MCVNGGNDVSLTGFWQSILVTIQVIHGVEHGAWSMEHGAWSVERGAWSVEQEACSADLPRTSKSAVSQVSCLISFSIAVHYRGLYFLIHLAFWRLFMHSLPRTREETRTLKDKTAHKCAGLRFGGREDAASTFRAGAIRYETGAEQTTEHVT